MYIFLVTCKCRLLKKMQNKLSLYFDFDKFWDIKEHLVNMNNYLVCQRKISQAAIGHMHLK